MEQGFKSIQLHISFLWSEQGLLRDMHSSSNVKLMEIGEGSGAERWGLVCQKYNEII